MTRYVVCDNCGAKDDWSEAEKPFFPDGVLLSFRDDNGDAKFVEVLEICPSCKEKLLALLPELKRVLSERHTPPSGIDVVEPGE